MRNNVTIVTSLFDLGRREGNPHRKNVDHYLKLSEIWFKTFEPIADNIVVFCDTELIGKLAPRSSKVTRLPILLEDTATWSHLDEIRKARETNPFEHRNEVKDTPLYGAFQRAKLGLLKHASRICGTSHVAWVDLGIAEAIPLDGAEDAVEHVKNLSKVQLLAFREPRRIEDWTTIHQGVVGGFIAGPCGEIDDFCFGVDQHFKGVLSEGFAPHDETLLEHFAWCNPDQFEIRRIDSHREIFRSFKRRARICLNMIVKNEAAIIERCLASVAPWIDEYRILDTGSTDGTQAFIADYLSSKKGVPGLITGGTFENFSQARNEALDLACDCECDWLLLCDADMQLVVEDPSFREQLSKFENLDALLVRQDAGISYDNIRLVRRDAKARYVGATHEFLRVERVAKLVGISFIDHGDGSSHKEKFERDERLLRKELEEKPDEPRTLFYLAQTMKDLGKLEDARYYYAERERVGGWEEETWYAIYMQARCWSELARKADKDPEGSRGFKEICEENLLRHALRAFERRPWRAEPLLLLSTYLRETNRPEQACAFARIGGSIPFPKNDSLFIETYAYQHGFVLETSIAGFYSKIPEVKEAARRCCMRLSLDRTAPCWVQDTARRNSVHYARSAKECFEATSCELERMQSEVCMPFVAMNPSVYEHEGEVYRIVRAVNYHVEDDGRYTIRDTEGVIRTENFLVLPGGRVLPIVDSAESMKDRTDYYIRGYEDLRLFRWRDAWWATCTVLDRWTDGRARVALLKLNVKADHVVVERCVVQEYGESSREKNWTPIVPWTEPSEQENLRILYSYESEIVLKVDPETLQANVELQTEERPLQDLRAIKGGSQLVPFTINPGRHERDGYLAVVHESIDGHGKRIYLHRLVWLSSDLRVRLVSEPFVFDHVGIEFAAGLCVVGDKVVISYGYEDREARYVEAPIRSVEGFLKGG